ncbi:hypothetical protein Lser_V15G10027 [Lactuca serriola]
MDPSELKSGLLQYGVLAESPELEIPIPKLIPTLHLSS